MAKINWKDNYLNTNEKPIGEDYKLHKYLFMPSPSDVAPYIAGLIKNKDRQVEWVYDTHNDAVQVTGHLIKNILPLSSGKINLKYIIESVQNVLQTYKRLEFYWNAVIAPNSTGWSKYKFEALEDGKCKREYMFATGILLEDYEDGDSDPYMTAGGYRSWKALAGSEVEYHLNADLSISVIVNSNCLVDHYNNNICGVSTGGGTTKYEIGERVERRVVNGGFGREIFNSSWKKMPVQAELKAINLDRFKQIVQKLQPELCEALNVN